MGRKKIGFSEEQLEEMAMMYRYGYSAREIAEWFGVDDNTVLRRLKERDVRIRPPRQEKYLFEKGSKPPNYVERDIPDPWEDTEAAYIFGVLIGDASISYNVDKARGKKTPASIELDTPDPEFRREFKDSAKSAFGIEASESPSSTKGSVVVQLFSVDLGRSYDRFKWRKERWQVPEPFFDAPEEIKVALCQGKFDSDGSPYEGAIWCNSIRKKGLEDIRKIAESLDYKTTFNGPIKRENPNWKEQYRIRVCDAPSNLVRLPRKKSAGESPRVGR